MHSTYVFTCPYHIQTDLLTYRSNDSIVYMLITQSESAGSAKYLYGNAKSRQNGVLNHGTYETRPGRQASRRKTQVRRSHEAGQQSDLNQMRNGSSSRFKRRALRIPEEPLTMSELGEEGRLRTLGARTRVVRSLNRSISLACTHHHCTPRSAHASMPMRLWQTLLLHRYRVATMRA